MPLREYSCSDCASRFTLLLGMTAEPDEEVCPHCGSAAVQRLVSRIAKVRSEDGRLDELTDNLEQMGEPGSYSQIRAKMREMGDALDDGMADEMEEIFEGDMESGPNGDGGQTPL